MPKIKAQEFAAVKTVKKETKEIGSLNAVVDIRNIVVDESEIPPLI